MIGAIFAYLYGKSRGRDEQRKADQKRRGLTPNELAQQEFARLIILVVICVAVALVLFNH